MQVEIDCALAPGFISKGLESYRSGGTLLRLYLLGIATTIRPRTHARTHPSTC